MARLSKEQYTDKCCAACYIVQHNTCDECVSDLKERIVFLEARLQTTEDQRVNNVRKLKTLVEKLEEQNRDLKTSGGCCEKPDYTGYAPCKSCGFDPTQ